jgi:hypothetical protein
MAVALSLSLMSEGVRADEELLESDWLELVRGFRGDTLGVTVVDIQEGESQDPRTITLAIPKTEVSDPNVMEEVLVIGQMPEKSEPLDISYEWLSDYDSDNYGLLIRLSKDTKWPIRLYLSSDAGFVR